MKKLCFLLLVLLLLLGGCSGDMQSDFFALPSLPQAHGALLEIVEQVVSEGFEFAEPRSGVNRSSLNLMDIDGDGEDEGIVFLRDITDTYKTYIYIFEQTNSVFSLFDIIEGQEKEIYTVSYSQLLDDKGYQIIVKWGSDSETARKVTAYNLTSNGVEEILAVSAEQFSVGDISGDGENEFLAVVNEGGRIFADIYEAENGGVMKTGRVLLSKNDGKVIRILNGRASNTQNAAFIERESEAGVITDVIAYNGEYTNLIPKGDLCRVRALCSDVDGDGITELPRENDISGEAIETDTTYIWRNLGEKGTLRPKAFTYHSFAHGWYLSMPMSWSQTVMAREEREDPERTKISFVTREQVVDSGGETYIEVPLFDIYVFKGANRKALATQEGRFIIAERDSVIFAAQIISGGYLGEIINGEFFQSAFKARESDWVSEVLFA